MLLRAKDPEAWGTCFFLGMLRRTEDPEAREHLHSGGVEPKRRQEATLGPRPVLAFFDHHAHGRD